LPLTAETFVGASGILNGIIVLLKSDAILVPTALVAVTVNVYEVPFVKPVIVIGEPLLLPVKFPGLEVTI